MVIFAGIVVVILIAVLFCLHTVYPDKWDYRSAPVVAFSFSAGVFAQDSTGRGETMPDDVSFAILVGLVIAITLACRYFRYSK